MQRFLLTNRLDKFLEKVLHIYYQEDVVGSNG